MVTEVLFDAFSSSDLRPKYVSFGALRNLLFLCRSYALPSCHSTFSSLTGHQIKNIQDTADKVGEFANKIRAIQAWAIPLELFGDVVEKKENFWTLASHCHENCCINFHGTLVPKIFFVRKGNNVTSK